MNTGKVLFKTYFDLHFELKSSMSLRHLIGNKKRAEKAIKQPS